MSSPVFDLHICLLKKVQEHLLLSLMKRIGKKMGFLQIFNPRIQTLCSALIADTTHAPAARKKGEHDDESVLLRKVLLKKKRAVTVF